MFDIILPTKLIWGENCVAREADRLVFGRHALIVTGKNSARLSGALDDVTAVLEARGVAFTVFDEITENPPLLTCYAGGQLGAEVGADFVIGIGGGSPLDAAKAIAAFAANPTIAAEEIYDAKKLTAHSLPIVAIPTTAGTGSEANLYSVLTLPDGHKKKTFKSEDSWPRVSFIDPKYTASLPIGATVSCALDAFAHALESYFSPKSTPDSEHFALWAAEKIWPILLAEPTEYTSAMRADLLYAATAAGIAISITGTGFPHPLGYSITLLDGIPHGAACAVFDGDFIAYNARLPEGAVRAAAFAEAIGTDVDTLISALPRLSGVSFQFSEAEIAERVELVAGASNYVNSPYVINREEMYEIYRAHFGV